MGRGSNRIYNVISLIFLVLAFVVLGVVIVRLGQPAIAVTPQVAALPTLANLPTLTPTSTHTPIPPTPTPSDTPTLTPTDTPPPSATFTWTLIPTRTGTPVPPTFTPLPSSTITPTFTPSDTPPPSATITPSLTITFTLTPSQTIPPSNTPQVAAPNNFTPQPTQPPPSPFPFRTRDPQPQFTLNFANSAGCQWQGIGGQVTDLNGQAIGGVRVHVYGSGIDVFSTSGSNTLYGASGWEVPLSNAVNTNVYFVELQSQGGTIISDTVQVRFPGNCQQNLALVNFQQTRDF